LKNRCGATLTKLGNSAVGSPISFEMSEPTVGNWMAPIGSCPVRIRYVPRLWSPSFVDIPRMTASRSPHLAICGRCSLILRPGAVVEISLNGPPLSCVGFRSHMSIVAGPPFIHRRMQDRLRFGSSAAARASGASQPETQTAALAAPTRRKWRRERSLNEGMGKLRGFVW
jgi:hypothetical protein